MVKSLIGAHTSIKEGILEGIKYIEKIGGNVIQIFLGSNQSASLKTKRQINVEEANAIRKYLKLNQLKLFIHAVYVLNLSSYSANSHRLEYARQNLLYDLTKGAEIGAKGVVVHLGYQKQLTSQEAYFNMADNVVKVVVDLLKYQNESTDKVVKSSRIKLILETPAGAGSQIGITIEELSSLWFRIKELSKNYQKTNNFISNYRKILDRIGFCIDTAHIFTSGNQVDNPATLVTYLEKFIKEFGKNKLTCFHINDSKAPFDSHRDLHEGLGQGYLFKDNMDTLRAIWKFSSRYEIPMILETHGSGFYDSEKDKGLYQVEINLFREWDLKRVGHDPVPGYLESYQKLSKEKKSRKSKKSKSRSKSSKSKSSKKSKKKEVSRLGNHYTMYKNNKLLVEILTRVKNYYQLIGDKIHVIAYQKAIYQLKRYPYNIDSGNQVANLPGIGKGMITKIDTIITTGKLPFLSQKSVSAKLKRLDSIDLKLDNLMEIPGIGEKKGTELIDAGYDTIKKVKEAVKNGDIKLTNMQLIGLKYHDNTLKKIQRLEAKKIYRIIKKSLPNKIKLGIEGSSKGSNKDSTSNLELTIIPAGSYPSGKPESKDIDIIIVVDNQPENIDSIRSNLSDNQMSKIMTQIVGNLKEKDILVDILSQGNRNLMGYINLVGHSSKVVHLDLKLVSKYNFPFTYLHFTSGVDFNRYIRNHANKLDYSLSDLGLFREVADIDTDNKIKVSDKDGTRNRIPNKKFEFNDDIIRNIVENEKKIFEHLGLNYVSIKNRR
jgi:apurinic endonuclease APN1